MKNSLLIVAILIIAIAGGAGLFYFGSKLPDNELINQNVNTQLLRIDTLDANVNELALRSRANIDLNYDMLVRSTVALERTVLDLSNTYFRKSEIKGSLLDTRFDNFKASLEIKNDQVEDFKSSNAVLRNSETYIPLVGMQLTEVAQQNSLPEVSNLYKQIVIEMLEFTRQGSNRQIDEVAGHRAAILESEELMPQESRIKVLEFANHVATAVEAQEKTDQYLSKLLNSSADEQIGEILSAWNLWQSENDNTQEILRSYIIAYVLTMLALIGILIFRLRGAYNSLDQEVEAKTLEIKTAYDELRDSERQLVQSEKMASLGQLVAGVAHEINTPLSYITSNIDTIKARYENLMPVLLKAEEISDHLADPNRPNTEINGILKQQIAAYRDVDKNNTPKNINLLIDDASAGLLEIKEIVDSLTNFSHVQDAPQQPVDINERINSCLKVCSVMLGDRKLTLDLTSDMPMVQGVSNQLVQVFTNIIKNATHATDPSSGVLHISTQLIDGSVEILFKDNGEGIDEESLKHVFEPFFTTKDVGDGTGLGLSISHRIIVAHKGEIDINSTVGIGTLVSVRLPITSS